MITSATNKKLKNVIALRDRNKERKKQGVFLTEGIKMFLEAPSDWVEEVYIKEGFLESHADRPDIQDKLDLLVQKGKFVEEVKADLFDKMSDTLTPQGVLCIQKIPTYTMDGILNGNSQAGLYLILEDIQDPGNLGTMIRAGEGAGIQGVIMSKGTVDVFNPKTIRATMGSIYRIPFYYAEDLHQCIKDMKKQGISVYAAHLKGQSSYDLADYTAPTAFLIGNEGNGLKDETAELATAYLKIPMLGQVESLNAAIAATLFAYEAARQRRQ